MKTAIRSKKLAVKKVFVALKRQVTLDRISSYAGDIPDVFPRPVPQGSVCEKMCERCPFRKDGTGYAQDHPDLPMIRQSVEFGLAFWCHETVIMDPRTEMNEEGEEPAYSPQPHFELCRGGHEYRMEKWSERARVFLNSKK